MISITHQMMRVTRGIHCVAHPEFILGVTTQVGYFVRQLRAIVDSQEAMTLHRHVTLQQQTSHQPTATIII